MSGELIDLRNSDDEVAIVQQAESCNILASFKIDDTAIAKANLITVTLTLYDEDSKTVINSRDGQDILDANGGSVDADGDLTLRLDADDNPIVSATLGDRQYEKHIARITWTWNDGVSNRTGKQELRLNVQKLVTVS